MILKTVLKGVPHEPGVYIFFNLRGKALYVGKAKDLHQRLSDYFQEKLLGEKTQVMIKKAVKLTHIKTVSETDALILEADLIKRFRPVYNVKFKDDKNYVSISLEKKSPVNPYPRLLFVRKFGQFGPFPQPASIRKIVGILRGIFNFRDCSPTKFLRHKKLKRGCLYFDLNLCGAPCALKESAAEYNRRLKKIKHFLKFGSADLEAGLRREMKILAQNQEYEKAGAVRNKLGLLEKINRLKFLPGEYRENPNLVEETTAAGLKDLLAIINLKSHRRRLTGRKKFRIEAYDVSHLMGRQATAALVVFVDGRPQPDEYRRFRIKSVKGIDDYQMLGEVINRRLKHADWPKPDLVLIDGGLGQVNRVKNLFYAGGVAAVVGLAKRPDRLVIGGSYLSLKKQSRALHLLQRIRDESHRFAKRYHQLLRLKTGFIQKTF